MGYVVSEYVLATPALPPLPCCNRIIGGLASDKLMLEKASSQARKAVGNHNGILKAESVCNRPAMPKKGVVISSSGSCDNDLLKIIGYDLVQPKRACRSGLPGYRYNESVIADLRIGQAGDIAGRVSGANGLKLERGPVSARMSSYNE